MRRGRINKTTRRTRKAVVAPRRGEKTITTITETKAPKKKRPAFFRKGWTEGIPFSSIGSGIGAGIGNMFAPGPGGILGGFIGGTAGAGAKALLQATGMGDYQIKYNTLMNGVDVVPSFSLQGDGGIRIRHKEYITDITTSATPGLFTVSRFPIDPSNAVVAPWLSQISVCYEEWRLHGAMFVFKSTSGTFGGSGTSQLGNLIMATQYNSKAAPYSDKVTMEAATFSCSERISENLIHPIECDPSQTPNNGIFYCNDPNISAIDNDVRFSQIGVTSVATQGCQASVDVGELWFSYDIELMKPRLVQVADLMDHWHIDAATADPAGGDGPYFGLNPTRATSSDGFTTLTSNAIYFSQTTRGNFLVIYMISGGAGAYQSPQFTITTSGISYLNIFEGNTQSFESVPFAITNTGEDACMVAQFVTVVPTVIPGESLAFGAKLDFAPLHAGSWPLPATSGDLFVIQIPSNAN